MAAVTKKRENQIIAALILSHSKIRNPRHISSSLFPTMQLSVQVQQIGGYQARGPAAASAALGPVVCGWREVRCEDLGGLAYGSAQHIGQVKATFQIF
jgi:hypothetical protein